MLARYERVVSRLTFLGGPFAIRRCPSALVGTINLFLFFSIPSTTLKQLKGNFEAIKGKSKGLDLKMGEVLGWEGRIWLM